MLERRDHETVERWLPVVGYVGLYEVSNLGRVRSVPRRAGGAGKRGVPGGLLAPTRSSTGYLTVALYRDGRSHRALVHRLVMLAFSPISGSRWIEVNHIDGNKQSNALHNLEWCTHAMNVEHSFRALGRTALVGSDNPASIPVSARNISTGEIRSYESLSSVTRDGFIRVKVSRCARGLALSHKGWEWKLGLTRVP